MDPRQNQQPTQPLTPPAAPTKLQNEAASYVGHLESSLDALKISQAKQAPTGPMIEGKEMGEQILNKQQFPFQKPLRTFEGDIADALKSKNISVAKIAIAEKVKKEAIQKKATVIPAAAPSPAPVTTQLKTPPQALSQAQPQTPPRIRPASPVVKNLLLFIMSILLVGGGGYLLYTFYWLPKSKEVTIPKVTIESLVPSDNQKELFFPPASEKTLADLLRQERDSVKIPQGSIEDVYITSGNPRHFITSQDLLSNLKATPPDEFVRTLEPQYMFGIHSFNGNNPFIILKTNYYQSAFAGMLTWEATMANDLDEVFSRDSQTTTAPQSTPLSTADILIKQKPFVDTVIKNKDVRVLTNQYGRITLLYTFIDNQTILIATNEFTLSEVLDRLINRRYVR